MFVELVVIAALSFMVIGGVAAIGGYLTGDPYKEFKDKLDKFDKRNENEQLLPGYNRLYLNR